MAWCVVDHPRGERIKLGGKNLALSVYFMSLFGVWEAERNSLSKQCY